MPRLTRGKFGWSEGSMVIIEVIYYERLIEFCGKVSLCHVLHKLSNELLKCALGLSDCRKKRVSVLVVWPGLPTHAQTCINLSRGDFDWSGDYIATLKNSSE